LPKFAQDKPGQKIVLLSSGLAKKFPRQAGSLGCRAGPGDLLVSQGL